MRRIPPALAVLVALALVVGACSTPSKEDRRAALIRDATQAVADYVAAVDRGDLQAANGMRCEAARLLAPDVDAFLAPVVDELHAALGPLQVQTLEIVSSIDGVTHLRLQLRGAAGPTYPALVREDGALRLCGSSVDGAAERVASAKTRDGVDATSTVSLEQLVGVTPPEGFTSAVGDTLPPGLLDQLPGFVAARGARWDGPGGRSISITAVDLDSPDHARAAQRFLEGDFLDAITDAIPGPTPAARGFRYVAGYQLYLQPPGVGSVGDYVGFRWGSRVVAVYVVPLTSADDHALALAAATALAQAAGA